jgi:hypothetical protein
MSFGKIRFLAQEKKKKKARALWLSMDVMKEEDVLRLIDNRQFCTECVTKQNKRLLQKST